MRQLRYILLLLPLFVSCIQPTTPMDEDDPIIASVFDKKLFYSDLQPMIQQESTAEDSILYTNAIIEKWVRDAILMYEAEKNIPADLDIEEMVNNYRSSLILMNYTQKLVHENLDTFISAAQLNAYYEENKSQFKLEEPIVTCIFLKVNKELDDLKDVEKLWKDEKYQVIGGMDDELFEIKLSGEDSWFLWKDIKSLLPNSFPSYEELKNKSPQSRIIGDFKYFLKVFDNVDENKTPPLSYIEDQAKKVILHKRQTELLDNLREDLYEKYSKSNNVKINL